MRLLPRCVVVVMLLLVPTAVRASDHVAGIFGAISALSGSTLRGGHGTLEVSLSNPQRVHDYFDLLVDSSVHAGEDDTGAAVTKVTLMFGGRALYRTSNGNGRYILFAHGMFGAHRSHIGAAAANGRAGGAGGGVDVLINNIGGSGWIWRNQLDWVRVAGKNSARFSSGFGFRYRKIP